MSGFLLDTNVISELVRPRPEPKVKTWIDATNENLLYLSVLTLGSGTINLEEMRAIVRAWLATEISEARHKRRVAKIVAVERQYR